MLPRGKATQLYIAVVGTKMAYGSLLRGARRWRQDAQGLVLVANKMIAVLRGSCLSHGMARWWLVYLAFQSAF